MGYGHARIPEFAFQVCRNGTAACGNENTIRHLIHKDTGDSIPCPVHDPEHIRIRRNQFPVAFHAMMIISLYGRAKDEERSRNVKEAGALFPPEQEFRQEKTVTRTAQFSQIG